MKMALIVSLGSYVGETKRAPKLTAHTIVITIMITLAIFSFSTRFAFPA